MAKDTDIGKLYDGRVNIWVEDEVTRAYLQTAWKIRGVKFLISGGADAVTPAVDNAQALGTSNVLGIIDGDFEESDLSRWDSTSIFRLPVHEIENFLLDPGSIAACGMNTNKRSPPQIEEHLYSRAEDLLWWMATCSVIKRIRHCLLDNFIHRPKPAVASNRDAACQHLHQSNWFEAFREHSREIALPHRLEVWLDDEERKYRQQLRSGDWRKTFSGKELFRHLRGFVFDDSKSDAKGSMIDVDLAMMIARWQVANNAVPVDVVLLRDTIKRRQGLV